MATIEGGMLKRYFWKEQYAGDIFKADFWPLYGSNFFLEYVMHTNEPHSKNDAGKSVAMILICVMRNLTTTQTRVDFR